jgi:hypothetical protein
LADKEKGTSLELVEEGKQTIDTTLLDLKWATESFCKYVAKTCIVYAENHFAPEVNTVTCFQRQVLKINEWRVFFYLFVCLFVLTLNVWSPCSCTMLCKRARLFV